MLDIRWRAFWLFLSLTFCCLIIWAVSTATLALFLFCVAIVSYLISHLYWLHALLEWVRNNDQSTVPQGSGIWEEVFATLYREQRRNTRNQTQLSAALDRFRLAAIALPDGVVLLNSDDKIEWCNPAAEKQLGLSLKKDVSQPVTYLIRLAEFKDFLQSNEYSQVLKLKSWRDADTILELQIVAFGENQKLMISRNISQLEKIENMRRDFIANVSHELRTPLTVVGGFLETLDDIEGAIPKSTQQYFRMMQEQTSRMRFLIEDLLTLSQLESDANVPQDIIIDIQALLSMVLNDARGLSNGRHQISLEIEPDITITGSLQELHSGFGNLVTNAIRYTPEGGNIEISWYHRANEAVFSVKDNGIGIEQKHLDRLTERFYRVDRSRSRETGGTGLGLSIVKHILTRHQARLEVESEYGKGSVFRVAFNKARVIHLKPQAKATDQ